MNNSSRGAGYPSLSGQHAPPSLGGAPTSETPNTLHAQLHLQQPRMPTQTIPSQTQQQGLPPGLVGNLSQMSSHLNNGGSAAVASAAGVSATANAGNPLYHPHQGDASMMANPIWKLQLQLASISRQSMGQANIYARQSAMRKYMLNNNQTAGGTLNEMSASLVDHTKQLLLEMAGDSTVLNNGSTSAVSTPMTPNAELNGNNGATTPAAMLQQKKLSQYNIDEDDETEHRRGAPKNSSPTDQLWHALDLSNIQLFNLNMSLFKYEFLTRLYLNGNNLTALPPSIKSLKNLRVLDLSQNRLTELPRELGLCYNLKYLYFFDNMVSNLPWEFGYLFNLQFLGIEGNPMDRQIIKILVEKSVTGLIFYLRDNAPEIPLPKDRQFLDINADGEVAKEYLSVSDSDSHQSRELLKKSFTLLSYNTLCQHYATPKMYRFTPSWALSWEYRREKLKNEILSYQTDVVCLQEVESKTFAEFWSPLMTEKGYSSIFQAKTRARTMQSKDSQKVDGCAMFYKNSEFKLLFSDIVDFSSMWMKHKRFQRTEDYLNRAMNKDNVALIIKLQHIKSGDQVWVATTHLHWDPQFNDVKTFQVGVLLDHLEKLIKEQHNCNNAQDLKRVPVVVCGDFNSTPDSAVYELFNTGSVRQHKDIEGRDFGYMSQKNFYHGLSLKSSYDSIGELPFTNMSPDFTDVIDYIWYSPQGLRVRGLLGEIDPTYASKFIGFPNDKFTSDHIALVSRFEFTKTSGGGSRKV
ncbi:LAMI_0F06590g1_1 [Lachancea mirantina]|uniref:CCR4-Not complex 3'-5'-exoribonuclease subunit Ccr4 n=1 Tax=Lachancea mirantina TaxID=1230905 RepID=A0A1G4JZ04_9SACH|nr:LAMI_0F06590g1_1 [Lachancea mirantina]